MAEQEKKVKKATSTEHRPVVLSLTLADRKTLYISYMPFINGGGLFVPTDKSHEIGEEVFLILTLPKETERMQISGKIVWITPKGAQGNRKPGVGIQLTGKDASVARTKIEAILGRALKSKRPTYTM